MAVAGSRLDFLSLVVQLSYWTAAATAGRRSFCRGPARRPGALCRGPALLLCVGARRSVSGPGALSVFARRFVLGPGSPLPALFLSGPGALCRGLVLFLSGPGAPSLCRGPALLCLRRGPALSGVGVGARHSSRKTVFVRSRQFVCRGPRRFLSRSLSGPPLPALFVSGPALFVSGRRSVSGPGAPCVGARCSLWAPKTLFSRYRRSVRWVWRFLSVCRGPTIARRSLCRGPTLCLSGPGALCVGARQSSPGAVCVGLCVGARRFLCPGPALCFGAGRSFFVSGPGALCRGPARCLSACRCLGFFVRPRRSSCRGPALSIALRRSLSECVWGLFLYRSSALLCSLCRGPALSGGHSVSGPGAAEALVAPSSHPHATHPARRVPFFQERTPNLSLGEKDVQAADSNST